MDRQERKRSIYPSDAARQPGAKSAQPGVHTRKIIAGEFDEDFLNWFEDAREFGKPILVEFGVEMNGGWFPWNARWNGAGELDGFGDLTVPDGGGAIRVCLSPYH